MNKVLKHYQLILIAVLIAALVLSIVTRPDSPVDAVNEYILNNKIDSLQKVIQTNDKKREKYNNNIIFLSDSIEGLNNEIKENDIPDLLNRYHNLANESDRARTDKSFLVPFEEIKANDWDLSINRYKEIIYEEIEYAAPSEIIQDIESLDQERNDALAALKEMLG